MNNNLLLITGSDGATAQGLIHYFADRYTHVVGLSRHERTGYSQDSVETMGVDMLNFNQVASVTDAVINKYGEINGWINCVGGFSMGNLIENEDDWSTMHSINFRY